MNADEKDTNDRASAGDASGGQSSDMEEVIDLVDEVSSDDDSSEPEQASEIDSKADDDEELIDLTDVVEESSSEPQVGDTSIEGMAEKALEPEGEQGLEEEEPIELTDEVVAEGDEELIDLTDVVEESSLEPQVGDTAIEGVAEEALEPGGEQVLEEEEPIELRDEVVAEGDSAQDQEGVFELQDLVDEAGFDAGESELAELSEAEIVPGPGDDSLIDNLGLEVSEEPLETPVEQRPEDEELTVPEEVEQSLVSAGETQPEAEELAKSGGEELGVEQEPEPVGGALEEAILERLSDEKLEEIITKIVRQSIDGKVERILLEAAEAAIGREIERLKQAL